MCAAKSGACDPALTNAKGQRYQSPRARSHEPSANCTERLAGSGSLRAHGHELGDTVAQRVKPFRRLRAHEARRILRTIDTNLALLTQIVDIRLMSVGDCLCASEL